ncbi:hypothetical protein [Rhodococcus kronopolitis]|uniref:Uncharacterized protein n=1 Tax=Rhodococcus kronopolitis TaxID=1460226 RepID=A0ABV9FUP0_9NOCA
MSRHAIRRVASVVAAGAMVAGALAGGAGTAVAVSSLASLGSSAEIPDLPSIATVTSGNLKITKEIVGDNKISNVGRITYRTTVAATGGPDLLLNKIVDLFPTVVGYVEGSATVTSWRDGAMKSEKVVPTQGGGRLSVDNSAGWVVSATGNKTVTLDVTYEVRLSGLDPLTDIFDSGVSIEVNGLAVQEWPAMGVKMQLLQSGGSEAALTNPLSIFGS